MTKNNAFLLGILETIDSDGNTTYSVTSQKKGIKDEVLITLLRHWLKRTEEEYHNTEFREKQ